MRPRHFEIQGTDPEKLAAYYGALFGWKTRKVQDMDYWMAQTGADGPGIDGAFMRRHQDVDPAPGSPVLGATLTMSCDDIDHVVSRAIELGGTEALAKIPVPGMGWVAYVLDPCGNVFGIWQDDEEAS